MVEPLPIQLQPGLGIPLPASIQVRVADGTLLRAKGRVVVALDDRAGGGDGRRERCHIKIGILQVDVRVRGSHPVGHGVDVIIFGSWNLFFAGVIEPPRTQSGTEESIETENRR